MGFSWIRADSAKQLSFGTRSTYAGPKWYLSGNLNLVRNAQRGVSLQRLDSTGTLGLILKDRWLSVASASFLASDEQQLSLRSSLIGAAGRFLLRNTRSELSLLGGAGWTTERFKTSTAPNAQSLEGVMLLTANVYNLGHGKVDSLTNLSLYPGISELGRLRYNLISELRWTLPKRLYFSLRVSNSYDSSPLNNASRMDYVFTSRPGLDAVNWGIGKGSYYKNKDAESSLA